jgi:ATP-binding cassette subfamily B protein
LDSLPEGPYTKIGERGYTLSVGEMQKLAIARALYRDPSILILDEATSSLDPRSEILIRKLIQSIREQGRTVIIIAHRMNSLIYCDKILCLNNKTLAESGSHAELMSKKGYYFRLWKNQFARDFIE